MADLSAIPSTSTSLDALVQQYTANLRKPLTSLENRRTTIKARMSALSDVKTKLDALLSVVRDLTQTGATSKFGLHAVSSSNSTVVTATASASVPVGSHTLLVTQLAKTDKVLSSAIGRTSTSIADAEGAGDKTLRVTVNGVAKDITVTLAAGDTNDAVLAKIATAVNAAGANVSAAAVAVTSTTSRLVLTSTKTGSANGITLEDVSGTLLNNIGLGSGVISARTASTATTGGYVTSDINVLDSKFSLDGVDIVRGTNSINDVIPGLTFELKGTQLPTDQPVNLVVGADNEKIKERVTSFISAYNDALAIVRAKTAIDPATKVREILAGDSTFTSLRLQMRSIVGGNVSGVQLGNPSMLAQLGIKAGADGSLSIADSAKLDEMLTTNASGVGELFTSTGGIASQLKTLLDSLTSGTGTILRTRDSLSSQVTYLTNRITRGDAVIARQAAEFRNEYARVQSTLAMLAQQQQFIQSVVNTTLTSGG